MKRALFDLSGKSVAVIGAASGIGRAVALGCAAGGAAVACLDLDGEGAERVSAVIGSAGYSAGLDIRQPDRVLEVLEDVRARRGGLHGVVTTPGVNVRKPILDYSDGEFERVVGLNLQGTFHVLQAAGKIMKEQGIGSILAFSSIRSVTVEPGQGVYAATKSGLVQLVRTLAAELGPHGVRVNAIAPGVVDTPLTRPIREDAEWYQAYAAKSALGRWAAAEEMAGPAVFLLSEAASYVTGAVLFVDGGWTAVDGRFEPPL